MPKVNVKVPHRSGFDKSHSKLLSLKCGTLVPVLVDELIPNTKVFLRELISAQLPPLATDTYMRVNLKTEAFFVPTRLLYGGFEKWLLKQSEINPSNDEEYQVGLPVAQINAATVSNGSLSDFLGVRKIDNPNPSVPVNLNIFPYLCYHRVFDDWYRNVLVERPIFQPVMPNQTGVYIDNMPFISVHGTQAYDINTAHFTDGTKLGALRQRNFGFDYFTGAMPNPQLGAAQKVTIDTSEAGSSFTIAALRAANSLQQFAERNQLAGTRLQDYVRTNYGADLSTGVAQRSIYLGSSETPVYSKGVYQTNQNNYASITPNPNPFSTTSAKFGDGQANGDLTLVKDFTAQEPGYLMVLCSLVPVVAYSNGIDRMMLRYNVNNSQTDMANPILQNVGNQPIYRKELTGVVQDSGVFGYTDRYADFKQKQSTIHGMLRDGQVLEAFALQRSVTGTPTISSDFLKIPTDYMDQIMAVTSLNDGSSWTFNCWLNIHHDYKVSMPLAEYSIPSLQDPAYEHGIDVPVEIGGSRI